MASLGFRVTSLAPPIMMVPLVGFVIPYRESISSVRPEPNSPMKPRISPFRTEKESILVFMLSAQPGNLHEVSD